MKLPRHNACADALLLQRVNREELHSAVKLAASVVDDKNPVGILQYVNFNDGTLQATDGVLSVVTRAPNLGRFCLSGEWLCKLLDMLQEEEVEIACENSIFSVYSGRHRSKTPVVDASKFPDLLNAPAGPVLVPGDGFSTAVKEVLSLTSEAKQLGLRGVGFWKNCVYATDGVRATLASWPGHIPEPVILPRYAADRMARAGDPKTIRVGASAGNVIAAYDGFVLLSRMLDSKIPFAAIDQMLAIGGAPIEWPADLFASVGRVSLMAGDSTICLRSDGASLHVSATSLGAGQSDEVLSCNLPVFEFRVNPQHFAAACGRTRHCDLQDVLHGSKRVIRFFTDSVEHLVGLEV